MFSTDLCGAGGPSTRSRPPGDATAANQAPPPERAGPHTAPAFGPTLPRGLPSPGTRPALLFLAGGPVRAGGRPSARAGAPLPPSPLAHRRRGGWRCSRPPPGRWAARAGGSVRGDLKQPLQGQRSGGAQSAAWIFRAGSGRRRRRGRRAGSPEPPPPPLPPPPLLLPCRFGSRRCRRSPAPSYRRRLRPAPGGEGCARAQVSRPGARLASPPPHSRLPGEGRRHPGHVPAGPGREAGAAAAAARLPRRRGCCRRPRGSPPSPGTSSPAGTAGPAR